MTVKNTNGSRAIFVALSFQSAGAAAFVCPNSHYVFDAALSVPTISQRYMPESCLYMSENSDRARMEKNLEDLMDNDWRLFRARLVAQERMEAEESVLGRKSPLRGLGEKSSSSNNDVQDEKHARQDKLGNLFAGAISSIFQSKNGNQKDLSIFDGDAVGGATAKSFLPPGCEDPFVSEDEIPGLLQPKVRVDKHRWAHPISNIEPGCVLVANEKLGGVFHQTVVLVTDHHEATGSNGIVINRPLPGNLLKIASETASNVDLSLKLAFNSAAVTYGGPVMQEEYSILHGYGEVEGAKKVAPGVFVGGSEELMNEVRKNNFHPSQALFVKGHASWVPSQLSREVSKGVWYVSSCSADLILRYAGAPVSDEDNRHDLWSDVLTCMGGEYASIAKQHSGRGDMRMMP